MLALVVTHACAGMLCQLGRYVLGPRLSKPIAIASETYRDDSDLPQDLPCVLAQGCVLQGRREEPKTAPAGLGARGGYLTCCGTVAAAVCQEVMEKQAKLGPRSLHSLVLPPESRRLRAFLEEEREGRTGSYSIAE